MIHNYLFAVHVRFPYSNEVIVQHFKLDLRIADAFDFKPYDLCDNERTAIVTRGVTKEEAKERDERRMSIIKKISDDIAKQLFEAIKSKDTINGYPKGATKQ